MGTFSTNNTYPFLQGGGEMGELIRNYDWSASSIGAPNQWPISLRTLVNMMLTSRFPMLIFWGPELITFYNDAFRPSLGDNGKHPSSLGQPGEQSWAESWPVIGPMIDNIMAGGDAVWFEDQKLPLYRNGKMDYVYWTYSFSPLLGDTGTVSGILVTCSETTKAVESINQYRNVADSSPTGLWLSDEAGGVTYLNKTLVDWTGMDYEDLLGAGWANAIIEADRQQSTDSFLKAVANKTHYDVQFRLKKADGQVVWCRAAGDPYYRKDGTFGGYAGYCLDIDEIVSGREAIQQREARFRSLIEQAPVATGLLMGRELIIELANKPMLGFWGKGNTVFGKSFAQVLPELESQPFIKILDEVYTTGKAYQATADRCDLVIDGQLRTFYFNFTYQPVFDEHGQVYAILNMAVDVTEQVIVRQRIEESQLELLTLFEQSPVGIAIIDANKLVFRMANPFYGELVGRQPSQIIGKSLLDALPELKGQGFDDLLKQVLATGIAYTANEVAVDLVRNNQMETIYVDLLYQPRREGGNGPISGILVVATDVTQQVTARKKIESSEAKLRSVITTAPAGMGLFVGRDLVVELPNQTFIDIVGKGPDIVGKPLREVMPELLTENQPFLQILDDVYTSGKMFQSYGSLVSIVQQGIMTHRYYNITYTPLRDEAGEVYAILDIAIDVTAQVEAQQALAESEAHLELLRDTVPAMIFYLDAEQRYQSYNGVFREWFGVDAREALGKTVREFIGEEAYKKTLPHLTKAYAGQQERYEMHAPNRMDGDRWLSIVYTPHITAEGNVIGLIVHATDISQSKQTELELRNSEARYRMLSAELELQVQKRTEELASANEELAVNNEELAANNDEYAAINEELEEANRLLIRSNDDLQKFAYVASHDLQEPLRKIQQFSDLLKTRYTQPLGEEALYLERMQAAASRMSTLIRDLLDFSRIATRRDINAPVPLNNVVDQALTTLELVIDETRATVQVGELPTVPGDASQLDQLFQNLLSNALKFRRPSVPPLIHIDSHLVAATQLPASVKPVRASSSYYRIDVADNGVGFDEKYLDRIFQVFQRLYGRNEYAGTGIGLAICEKVVANHGGSITAISQPGQGATFSIYLPAERTW